MNNCPQNTSFSNIKLTELADALGLKLSTVSRVVHGSRLSISIGQAIAEHLGKPIDDIFPAIHKKILLRQRRNQKPVIARPACNTEHIRKACWHLMVDLGLVRKGCYAVILPHLTDKTGRPININTLIMALSGERQGPTYRNLLADLHDLLKNWPQKAA
jgi:transcriptional regulator with XRE-family HTH domain